MAVGVSVRGRGTAARRGPAASTERRRGHAAFDRDYWIAHSEGYRVEDDHGRLGLVETLRASASGPILVVRGGMLGRRVREIPAADVDFVVPRAQRLWVRTPHR